MFLRVTLALILTKLVEYNIIMQSNLLLEQSTSSLLADCSNRIFDCCVDSLFHFMRQGTAGPGHNIVNNLLGSEEND